MTSTLDCFKFDCAHRVVLEPIYRTVGWGAFAFALVLFFIGWLVLTKRVKIRNKKILNAIIALSMGVGYLSLVFGLIGIFFWFFAFVGGY